MFKELRVNSEVEKEDERINEEMRKFLESIGSALAGTAVILVSQDVDMTSTMGMDALLMGVVATVIGGVGNIKRIVLGSLLLALAQNFGVRCISSQWQ